MKPLLASFILFTLLASSARADIDTDIAALTDGYERILVAIGDAPEKDRSRLYEKLREHATAMACATALSPNGDNALDKTGSDRVLVDLVYGAFSANQVHLQRVIAHTKDGERAVAIMPDRARSLTAVFPVCSSTSDNPVALRSPAFSECVYFMQYLARAYPVIPESLVKEVRQQMPRWEGEQRIPGLLVLSENGDAVAKAELDRFTSESAQKLGIAFRVLVDSTRKAEQDRNAQQITPGGREIRK